MTEQVSNPLKRILTQSMMIIVYHALHKGIPVSFELTDEDNNWTGVSYGTEYPLSLEDKHKTIAEFKDDDGDHAAFNKWIFDHEKDHSILVIFPTLPDSDESVAYLDELYDTAPAGIYPNGEWSLDQNIVKELEALHEQYMEFCKDHGIPCFIAEVIGVQGTKEEALCGMNTGLLVGRESKLIQALHKTSNGGNQQDDVHSLLGRLLQG